MTPERIRLEVLKLVLPAYAPVRTPEEAAAVAEIAAVFAQFVLSGHVPMRRDADAGGFPLGERGVDLERLLALGPIVRSPVRTCDTPSLAQAGNRNSASHGKDTFCEHGGVSA